MDLPSDELSNREAQLGYSIFTDLLPASFPSDTECSSSSCAIVRFWGKKDKNNEANSPFPSWCCKSEDRKKNNLSVGRHVFTAIGSLEKPSRLQCDFFGFYLFCFIWCHFILYCAIRLLTCITRSTEFPQRKKDSTPSCTEKQKNSLLGWYSCGMCKLLLSRLDCVGNCIVNLSQQPHRCSFLKLQL